MGQGLGLSGEPQLRVKHGLRLEYIQYQQGFNSPACDAEDVNPGSYGL